MTETTRQTLATRHKTAGFPTITLDSGSRRFEGADGHQRLFDPDRHLNPSHEAEIERQLSAAEGTHAANLRRETAETAENERRAHLRQPIAPGDPEAIEHEAMMRDAAALAGRDAGPATYGQVAELIGVTRDVLVALQRRG
jgi:hypothetical protein